MTLATVSDIQGVPTNWDWKSSYVERLRSGAGMEIFSEASVTPDTTLLLAGPPRIDAEGFTEALSPIGLVTDVTFNADNGLRPMWELGTDQTYFTRGKTSYSLSIGAMVASKPSLMKVMSRQSPQVEDTYPGFPAQSGQFWMNLDTEVTAKPFGLMMIFKTKGEGGDSTANSGEVIGSMYLENCNIGNFSFGINSQAISIQENVNIMFDRALSVDYATAKE